MKKLISMIGMMVLLIVSSPPVFGSLPRKVFAPYVDVTVYPTFSLMNCYNATGQKYYILAFITANGSGQPAWGGVTTMDQNFMLDQISQLRAVGGDVILSFGGENGTMIDATITNLSTLVSTYQSIINQYGATWLDFDIEGGAQTDVATLQRRDQAVKQLMANNSGLRVSYTLPVEPTGLINDGLTAYNQAKSDGVNLYCVNVMAMDYGSYYAPNGHGGMGGYAISAGANTHTQTGTNVGITPMIGQNDASDELFSLSDAQQLVSSPGSATVMLAFWSAGRDNGGCAGQTYASPTCSGVAESNYQYISTFKSFSGSSGGGGGSQSPSVSITSPTNGATFTAPASITISASASTPSGTSITQVQFFQGSTSLGTDNTSPYSVTWSNVAAGTYSLTAKVTNSASLSTTSSAVSITVGSSGGGGGTGCYTAWSATQVYTGGMTASENGINYTAAYWTQGNDPATNNGPAGSGKPWVSDGACGSGGGGGGTADFSLSASPSSMSVTQGSSGTSTITVNKLNGFSSSVSLAASGLSSGVTASFNPSSTTGTSTLTLTASSSATTGSSTVTVTGTSGSLSHTATISLTVNSSGGGGGTGSCSGVAAWSATTTYSAGAQVTYNGSLYKALVTTTNVQPSYCPACGWWQLVGPCTSGNVATQNPAVSKEEPVPTKFAISAFPNPFNPSTSINIQLPEQSYVTARIYDALGREVTELFNGDVGAGYQHVVWNASDVGSGLYLLRINVKQTDGTSFSQTRKLMLTK